MVKKSTGFNAGIGIVIIMLAVSVLVPALFLNLENPQTTTFEQTELERITITGEVSSEVTEITNQGEVNVTLLNKRSGDIAFTGELEGGESTNVTLGGETIAIHILDSIDSNTVLVSYEYPLYLGWPDGASVIIKNITTIIVLATSFLILGTILTGFKVFAQ